jgi:quercetin dioxygenase-like cupin family protein
MKRRLLHVARRRGKRSGEDDETLHVLAVSGAAWRNTPLDGSGKVEIRGVTSEVKIEEVIFGHLTELNGKFKLRATELTFAPDGYVGVHHHVGPGIRYVISGELTFAEGGQETVYKPGEYFFETGNLAHTARNKTNVPLRILVVEILPKDWTAPAMIAPKSQ